MLSIKRFIETIDQPDPLGFDKIKSELMQNPGMWAEIEGFDGFSKALIHNKIRLNKDERFPAYNFDVKIVEGKFYMRYIPD